MTKARKLGAMAIVVVAMTLLLAACTGSTAPRTSSTFTGCSQPDYVTTWAVADVLPANGRATTTVSAGHYNDCEPVPNTLLRFTLQGVCGTVSANRGVTDSKGLVVLTYRASSKAGTCEISVFGEPLMGVASIKRSYPRTTSPPRNYQRHGG